MASLHQAKKRLDLAERLDKNTPIERDVKTALQRVEACRSKLERADIAIIDGPYPPLAKLANDLDAWKSLNTSVRTLRRKTDHRDVADEKVGEIVVVIYWMEPSIPAAQAATMRRSRLRLSCAGLPLTRR